LATPFGITGAVAQCVRQRAVLTLWQRSGVSRAFAIHFDNKTSNHKMFENIVIIMNANENQLHYILIKLTTLTA